MSAEPTRGVEARQRIEAMIEATQAGRSELSEQVFASGPLAIKSKRLLALVGTVIRGDEVELREQLAACAAQGASWQDFFEMAQVVLATGGSAVAPRLLNAAEMFDPKPEAVEALEVPSLDELVERAQRAFPPRYLENAKSAACFFCARTFGRNDVIHVYKQGIEEVLLVDVDEPRMQAMQQLYPTGWKFRVADAFAVAAELAAQGKCYDVLILDPFTGLNERTLIEEFRNFYDITSQYLLCFIPQRMLDREGLDATPEAFSRFMSQKHQMDIRCVDLIRRSSHGGGTYWMVLDKT